MNVGDLSIAFRSAEPSDLGFIFDSWLESFKGSHAAGPLPPDLYWSTYREVIRRLIQKPSVGCIVAYNTEEPEQVFGYVVYDADSVCHYLFVKQFTRRMGVASALLAAAGLDPKGSAPLWFSFKTPAVSKLKSWTSLRFSPAKAK